MTDDKQKDVTPKEQRKYATFLMCGAWTGIVLLVLTYIIYICGLAEPYISLDKLPEYWSMNSSEYVEQAGVPANWGWVDLVGHADFLNFVGIALLGMLTIVGLLTLIPAYIRKKNWYYVAIVCLQVIVLSLAASGVLTGI